MNGQTLLQDMIDIDELRTEPENSSAFSVVEIDSVVLKRDLSKILDWLLMQKFVGDTELISHIASFSSDRVVRLVNTIPALQKYFQIRDGALAFMDGLSDEEMNEMIQYVKKNYHPKVHF
jgi:hypothetical protein